MTRVVYHVETVPPPFLTGTTAWTQPRRDGVDSPSSSSSSSSSSVIIAIIIISSVIIVSASIYLLRRCFLRRSSAAADDVVSFSANNHSHYLRDRSLHDQTSSSDALMENLPVFTFGSVTGNLVGGDCAVCLSKFEPNDQLRLLPLCCHAFHTQCIDSWLLSNQTCPLCRSTIHPTETDVLNKILSASEDLGNSFRIEIGSLSRQGTGSDSGDGRRSYSIGSFEYVMDDGYEVPVGSTHRRGASDHASVDKDSIGDSTAGESLAADVAGGRSWLRDYVDRLASISSRTLSFRSSGRFFTGSSRRSEVIIGAEDLEASRIGEEISELFRWLSGV